MAFSFFLIENGLESSNLIVRYWFGNREANRTWICIGILEKRFQNSIPEFSLQNGWWQKKANNKNLTS